MRIATLAACLSLVAGSQSALAACEDTITARGIVFEDTNRNGKRDDNEPGLAGVRVSNGRDFAVTDDRGRYELKIDAADAIVFLIKPRGFQSPLNKHNLPQFHYIHKPDGSPGKLKYKGVAPTGALPASVDFALYKRPEPNEFKVIMFGDPQPNNLGDIDHMANDVVSELIGTDAAFGMALGDLMADLLDLYEPYNQVMARLGIPMWNVPGNHDLNMDVPNDRLSNETWKRIFGPTTYSFDFGPVHFIVLDNILWRGNSYGVGFDKRTLKFVENDLRHVPNDRLIVIAMHAPLFTVNSADLFALLKDRPNTLSFSGHHHDIEQRFMGKNTGWPNKGQHHHVNVGAICGIHWLGRPDEFGIPHAMTHCGSPNGYPVVTFKGNRYSMQFRAPRRKSSDQMHLVVPNEIVLGKTDATTVLANIYWGNERSRVELQVDRGPWRPMTRSPQEDPYLKKVIAKGHPLSKVQHMWAARLPGNLPTGGHTIRVRTVDMYGRTYFGTRITRVVTRSELKARERARRGALVESGASFWKAGDGDWATEDNWSLRPSGRSVFIHRKATVTLRDRMTTRRMQLAEGAKLLIHHAGALRINGKETNYVGSGYLRDAHGAGILQIKDKGQLRTTSSIALGDREASPGQLTLSGNASVEVGGGLYIGVRSQSRVVIEDSARCVVKGPVQLGWGSDLGSSPSATIEMRGGRLEAHALLATAHCRAAFLFSGGTIVLQGDQRGLLEKSWFWTPGGKRARAKFDSNANATTLDFASVKDPTRE